MIQCLFS